MGESGASDIFALLWFVWCCSPILCTAVFFFLFIPSCAEVTGIEIGKNAFRLAEEYWEGEFRELLLLMHLGWVRSFGVHAFNSLHPST